MLSERERKELGEIERGLRADDPNVARGFEEGFDRKPRTWPYTTVIVFAAIFLVIGIVGQLELTVFLALAVMVGAIAGRRGMRRRASPRSE